MGVPLGYPQSSVGLYPSTFGGLGHTAGEWDLFEDKVTAEEARGGTGVRLFLAFR